MQPMKLHILAARPQLVGRAICLRRLSPRLASTRRTNGQKNGDANSSNSKDPFGPLDGSLGGSLDDDDASVNGLLRSDMNFLSSSWAKLRYTYYSKWRQGLLTDMLLIAGLNSLVLPLGYVLRRLRVLTASDAPDAAVQAMASMGPDPEPWYESLWQSVLVFLLGEPPDRISTPTEAFLLTLIAFISLAGFGLVLALFSEMITESLTQNVAKGSKVFEKGHTLVVGWADSQLDFFALHGVIQQLCLAYKDAGKTIVVMTLRPKIAMEEHFRDALPESERCGCKIVFRSGHPTSLHSLRLCGAEEASKIIILSDFSRPALESDAQNIRCGVVLDEMMSARYGRAGGPNVVLQLHSRKSAATSAWSSTSRIIAVPTGIFLARRLVCMLRAPVTARVTSSLISFNAESRGVFVDCAPLVGLKWSALPFYFPDSTVLGKYCKVTHQTTFQPDRDYVLRATDEVLLLCPPTSATDDQARTGLTRLFSRITGRGSGSPGQGLGLVTSGSSLHPGEISSSLNNNWTASENVSRGTSQQGPSCFNGNGASTPDLLSLSNGRLLALPVDDAVVQGTCAYVSPVPVFDPEESPAVYDWIPPSASDLAVNEMESHLAVSAQKKPAQDVSLSAFIGRIPRDSRGEPHGRTKVGSAGIMESVDPEQAQMTTKSPSKASGKRGDRSRSKSPRPRDRSVNSAQHPGLVRASPDLTLEAPAPGSPSSNGNPPLMMPSDLELHGSVFDSFSALSTVEEFVLSQKDLEHGEPSDSGSAASTPPAPATPPPAPTPATQDPSLLGPGKRVRGLSDVMIHHDEATARTTIRPVKEPSYSSPSLPPPGGHGIESPEFPSRHSSRTPISVEDELDARGRGGDSTQETGTRGRTRRRRRVRSMNESGTLYVPAEFLNTALDARPIHLLVVGWGRDSLMYSLLFDLDKGSLSLPPGSSLTCFTMQSYDATIGRVLSLSAQVPHNFKLNYVHGNPLEFGDWARLLGSTLPTLNACLILCDRLWEDSDNNVLNGFQMVDAAAAYRLDAMLLMAGLNLRKLLYELGLPPIHIVSEKLSIGSRHGGVTRFEDSLSLPLGVTVNLREETALALSSIALDPRQAILVPLVRAELVSLLEASSLSAVGDELSWWDLVGRAQRLGHTLLGFYRLPTSRDEPVRLEVNPTSIDRSTKLVWNSGDRRTSFIVLSTEGASLSTVLHSGVSLL